MRQTNCLSHWNMVVFISFKILKHYIELVHVSITICGWLFQEVLVQPHWKHKSNNYTSNRNSHNICVWGHVMIFTWWHTQVLFNQYPCMCHQVEIAICGQTLLVVPIAVKVCNQGFFQTLWISICNQICSMTSPGLQALTTNKKRFIPPEAMFHNVGNWESAISGCLMYKVKICWVDWLWGGPYYGVQLIPLVQLHNILNFLQIILT